MNFSHLPDLVGPYMWANLDIPEILNLVTNSTHRDWFTRNVIVAPTDFAVQFVPSLHDTHWEIRMKFKDRPEFVWYLWRNLRRMGGARMRLQIAGHQLWSKEVPPESPEVPAMLYSFVSGGYDMIVEILDWLAVLFRFEMTNFMVDTKDGGVQLKANWGQLARAKDVLISDCQDSSFLTELLANRHANGLRTLIEFAELENPGDITLECLSSLDYLSARINFTLLDSAFFIDYIRAFIQRDVPNFHILRAEIPPWSLTEVQAFKEAANLEDSTPILRRTHEISNQYTGFNDSSRKFHFQKNENMILAFYFLMNAEKQYTKVVVASWLPRPP